MYWPAYLLLGVWLFLASYRASDGRGEWVSGLWVLGILAMQFTGPEPWRWVIAGALWPLIALWVAWFVGAARAGYVMLGIPVGYWLLTVDSFGIVALGTGGRNLAFWITEAFGVAAVLIGCWRSLRDLGNGAFGRRFRYRIAVLGRRISVDKTAPKVRGSPE